MIHNKFRYLLTLVALFAISTGAWAQEEVLLTTVTPTSVTTYSQSPDGIVTVSLDNITAYSSTYGWIGGGSVTVEAPQGYTITRCVFRQNAKTPVVDDHAPFTATIANNHGDYYVYAETTTGQAKTNNMDGISTIEVYGTYAPAEPTIYTTAVDMTSLKVGDILAEGFSLTSTNQNGALFNIAAGRGKNNESISQYGYGIDTKNITSYGANATFTIGDGTYYPIDENGNVGNAWVVTQECTQHQGKDLIKIAGVTIEPPLKVTWDASTKTGTFSMPGSDVVLTPIYSEATIYGSDGQTEKSAYETLKEAFAAVQDGDVIKLDWNVTVTEQLQTPITDGGVRFTLDFNGYTLDGTALVYAICLNNNGDRMTFIDSTEGEMGGLKGSITCVENAIAIFTSGRANAGYSAETLNYFCSKTEMTGFALADGKEFVDLEGGADANDGFTVRVAYKTFELAIDSKRFATFYSDMNIKLAEQPAEGVGLYTISSIDADRSTATVTPISGIIPAGTPMLVYNGTEQKQTAKLIVTLDNAQDAVDWAPQFKGTATDREFTADDMAAADYYALSGGKAFAPVKGAGTLGANQCWLQFDKQEIPSARQFTLVFDSEATGIKTTDCTDYTDSVWYDLNGRKVAAPSKKGIYVVNGKKVVVK